MKFVKYKGCIVPICIKCGKPPACGLTGLCDPCHNKAVSLYKMDRDWKKILGGC